MHSNNDGMDPNWRPKDSDSFDETQFARAERLSRELYFSEEKLKSFYRMAERGVWVESETYSALIKKLDISKNALLEIERDCVRHDTTAYSIASDAIEEIESIK